MAHLELLNKLNPRNRFIHLNSGSIRLLSVFVIVFGLIGLVVGQGINKPESSLSALDPVWPHAIGEIFEDQSVLLNLPVEGVVVYVSPTTFVDEGTIVASITNSDQDEYNLESDWMDYRELNIAYYDSKGERRVNPLIETPIVFCYSFSDKKGVREKPESFRLSGLVFWKYDQENETWSAISTNIPAEKQDTVCGKTTQLTNFVLVGGRDAVAED